MRHGSGPAVILLHGIASSIFTWRDVLPALSAENDVLAVDLPGFGGSDVPAEPSVEVLRSVVVGLMDRLAISQASFVGNSLGGAVAAFVAAREPERVDRLMLIDAAGFHLALESRPWLLRVSGGPLGAMVSRLPRPRPLVALGLRQVFHDASLVTRERLDEYEAPFLRPGTIAGMRALLNAPAPSGEEFAKMLGTLRIPTLVVWGEGDRWIPVADADRFVAAIPGARKALLPSCGHMPQEERPGDVLALLHEIL